MAAASVSPRILLVEGDGSLAQAIAGVLAADGCSVEAVTSFEAAADALAGRVFDLVVCDTLRGGPGQRLLGQAVELQRRATPTPVGLITAYSLPRSDAALRNFAFCLGKPFTGEALLSAIAGALGGRVDDNTPEARVIAAYFAALGASDWDGLAALCDPEVVYFLPIAGPLGRMVVGRAAFRQFAVETFAGFPSQFFSDVAVYPLAHGLVARYLGRWVGPDGAPQQFAGAVVFHLKDGLIARIGVDLDDQRLARVMAPET